ATGKRNHQRVVAGQQNIDPDNLEDGEPVFGSDEVMLELGEHRTDGRRIENSPVHGTVLLSSTGQDAPSSDKRTPVDVFQPTISLPVKDCAISTTAVSGESDPCTEFSPIDLACALRMVPSAAFGGSVAPITSRYLAIAPS